MKVIIITESGKNIGYGHVNRCYAIAQAFNGKGITPDFITNIDDKKIFTLVKYIRHDIAIIDSYLKNLSFYRTLAGLVKLIVYLDDNNRLRYPKGIVINGNIYAKNIDYPENIQITYLLGTKYTPLRKVFWEMPKKEINKTIKNVLVTFGGSDSKGMTSEITDFLKINYPILKIIAITGKSITDEEMKSVMLKSDIAISGGGQTLNELARVGVPTIVMYITKNQLQNIEMWKKVGFVEEFKDDVIERLKGQIIRKEMSAIGRNMIDGQGAKKIVNEVLELNEKNKNK
ncbi:hypothetical protein ES705_04712 [subsurface metagenome]